MSVGNRDIQQQQSRQDFVWQYINEAYEIVRDDKADPPIQPKIQLSEGWQNGNIHITDVPGIPVATVGHTWDVWIVAPAGTDWILASEIYIKRPS